MTTGQPFTNVVLVTSILYYNLMNSKNYKSSNDKYEITLFI